MARGDVAAFCSRLWRRSAAIPVAYLRVDDEPSRLPTVELDEETIERFDALRVDDALLNERKNIYEAGEYTMFRAGD